MPNCQQITELVTEYLEGAMSFTDRMMFQAHIAMCPSCKNYLRQMELTVESTGEISPEPIPDEVSRELMEAFRGWKHGGDPGA